MTQQQRLQRIAERLRSPDMLTRQDVPGQIGEPYTLLQTIINFLVEIQGQLLRECSLDEMEAIGSLAIKTLSMTSGSLLPMNAIDVLQVAVDGKVAIELSAAHFASLGNMPSTKSTVYAIESRKILYLGMFALVTMLVEPSADDWQSNPAILPPSKDEEAITWVCRMVAMTNALPEGIA